EDFFESNEEFSSTDDDSFFIDKIDYIEASPLDFELVSSKVLFDAKYESDSSDDQLCFDEDVLEKIVSKPLSEEEIIPMKSLRTHVSSLPISSTFDSLLDEFAGELTLLKSIPPRIDENDCDFKEDIRLIEKLLYDNSSPRPPEEFVSANSDAKIKSFSPSPILLRIVTLLWRKLIYSVLRTTQCRRALRTRIMTLKGIFSFLRTCLEIIPFHLLKKSHSILIFLRFLSKMPHLCFLNKGIRLKSSFLCVTWLSVCTFNHPIGNEDYASWERGKGTWGGWERCFGTVPSKMPHLCFVNKGIRLKSSFLCVTWLSVCTFNRPIGNEDYASWERGKGTWGGWERCFGTVPVCVRVQE
nr:hypothetical protein [Tanacetum cinerariifolium]